MGETLVLRVRPVEVSHVRDHDELPWLCALCEQAARLLDRNEHVVLAVNNQNGTWCDLFDDILGTVVEQGLGRFQKQLAFQFRELAIQ